MSIMISNEKYVKGFELPKLYSHWSVGKEDELELALRGGGSDGDRFTRLHRE